MEDNVEDSGQTPEAHNISHDSAMPQDEPMDLVVKPDPGVAPPTTSGTARSSRRGNALNQEPVDWDKVTVKKDPDADLSNKNDNVLIHPKVEGQKQTNRTGVKVERDRDAFQTNNAPTKRRATPSYDNNEIDIIVTTSNGRKINVKAVPFETVEKLRQKIALQDGAALNSNLSFQGRNLANNMTLKEAKLQNNSSVSVTGKVNGGF